MIWRNASEQLPNGPCGEKLMFQRLEGNLSLSWRRTFFFSFSPILCCRKGFRCTCSEGVTGFTLQNRKLPPVLSLSADGCLWLLVFLRHIMPPITAVYRWTPSCVTAPLVYNTPTRYFKSNGAQHDLFMLTWSLVGYVYMTHASRLTYDTFWNLRRNKIKKRCGISCSITLASSQH